MDEHCMEPKIWEAYDNYGNTGFTPREVKIRNASPGGDSESDTRIFFRAGYKAARRRFKAKIAAVRMKAYDKGYDEGYRKAMDNNS